MIHQIFLMSQSISLSILSQFKSIWVEMVEVIWPHELSTPQNDHLRTNSYESLLQSKKDTIIFGYKLGIWAIVIYKEKAVGLHYYSLHFIRGLG